MVDGTPEILPLAVRILDFTGKARKYRPLPAPPPSPANPFANFSPLPPRTHHLTHPPHPLSFSISPALSLSPFSASILSLRPFLIPLISPCPLRFFTSRDRTDTWMRIYSRARANALRSNRKTTDRRYDGGWELFKLKSKLLFIAPAGSVRILAIPTLPLVFSLQLAHSLSCLLSSVMPFDPLKASNL